MTDEFKTLTKFDAGQGREGFLHSLPALEGQGVGKISRLPVSIRIVLESVLRNCDGKKVRRKDVEALAKWNAKKPANEEIPFVVARIVLQDFTGVPLVVDLAAMRSAVKRLSSDPQIIEPLVPVDLVVDHSVQVDFFGSAKALQLNLEMEFKRNRERYQFLKWGQQAFKTFQLIPPGIGIVHQVNLEYLAKGVQHAKIDIFHSVAAVLDRFLQERSKGFAQRWKIDPVLWALRARHGGLHVSEIDLEIDAVIDLAFARHPKHFLGAKIILERCALFVTPAGGAQIGNRFLVDREKSHGRAVLGRHVSNRRAVRHRQRRRAFAIKLDKLSNHALCTQHLRDVQNQIGRSHTFAQLPCHMHAHDFRC